MQQRFDNLGFCTQKFTKRFRFKLGKQSSIFSPLHLSCSHRPPPFSHQLLSSRPPSPSPPPSSPPSPWWPAPPSSPLPPSSPPPSSPPPSQAPEEALAWGCVGSSPSPPQWPPPSGLPSICPSSY